MSINHNNTYLHQKIQPYNPKQISSVEDALVALQKCSFQGRNLGRALEVLTNMVKKPNTLRVLTFSGAMTPAGMEEIVSQAIERKVIGAIVSTGANIIHSVVNAFAEDYQAHFVGSPYVDDRELYKLRINRIYDTFLPEKYYEHTEKKLLELLRDQFPEAKMNPIILSPSELFKIIGLHLPEKSRSFVRIAALHNVPIFCGATSDSELSLDLAKFRRKGLINIVLDEISDINNFATLIQKYDSHGTIIVGGGVPRNWAQQIFPYLDQLESEKPENERVKYDGYDYSVRFHTAVAEDGGLSGCTISESISWGKYAPEAKHQSVWGDATISFPLVMTALFQRMDRLGIKIE